MATAIIQLGEDKIMELPLTRGASVVDITTSVDVRVHLFVKNSNTTSLLYKYSKTTQSGYGTCIQKTGTGNENVVQVKVERYQSKGFLIGPISAEVLVEFTDSTFPSSKRHEVYTFPYIGDVNTAKTITEALP